MQRIVPLYVDHVGWGSMDIWKSIGVFEKLGFIMLDPPPDDHSFHMCHFYMDHGKAYVELYALTKDGQMWSDWATGGKPAFDAKAQTGVYSFVLSTRDIEQTRKAAMEAGFPCTTIQRGPRQNNIYASIGGAPGKAIFQFKMNTLPFPNAFFAVMEHIDENNLHFYRDHMHMYHDNGVTGASGVVLYYETPEDLLEAQRNLNRIQDAIAPFADVGYYSEYVRLLDKAAYEHEFGAEGRTTNSPVVALEFENADLDYIIERAGLNHMSFFEKNQKVYIDARNELNTFLIFK